MGATCKQRHRTGAGVFLSLAGCPICFCPMCAFRAEFLRVSTADSGGWVALCRRAVLQVVGHSTTSLASLPPGRQEQPSPSSWDHHRCLQTLPNALWGSHPWFSTRGLGGSLLRCWLLPAKPLQRSQIGSLAIFPFGVCWDTELCANCYCSEVREQRH